VLFHIKVGILKHVELYNLVGTLMDQTLAQEPRILII